MNPEDLALNSDALQRAFAELGITPEDALLAEGRQVAGSRFANARARAEELGQAPRIAAIEARIERDAMTHARREMARLGIRGAAGDRASAPVPTEPTPVPARLPSANEMFGIAAPGQPQMPAPHTLTGAPVDRRNAAERVASMPGSALGIDWNAPRAGSAFEPSLGTADANLPDYFRRGRVSEGMAANPLMPQSAVEASDQRSRNATYGQAMETGRDAALLLAAPEARAAELGVNAARFAAQSAPAQWVAGQVARNPLLAGATVAGGATLATSGRAADAPPLPSRATDARRELQAAQKAADDFANSNERLEVQANINRFDPKNFNWGDPAAIEAAQSLFQREGIRVPNDKGQLVLPPSDKRDGPLTRAAVAEYRRQQQEVLRTREAAIAGRVKKAEDAIANAETLDNRDYTNRRLKEMNEPSWWDNNASTVGLATGAVKGIGERYVLGRMVGAGQTARADRANALLDGVGTGSVNDRVGRINQFWTEGGSRNSPFAYTPGAAPYPWTAVPDAARGSSVFTPRDPAAASNASRLYRPGPMENYAPIAATAGLGGAEWYAGAGMLENARRELEAANAALQAPDGRTENNIQRFSDARAAVATAEFLRGMGRGEVAGSVATDLKIRAGQHGARPQVGRAEAERGDIDMLLNQRAAPLPPTPPIPPPAGPPPPAPVWDAGVGRWRLNGGFVSNGPAPVPAPRGRR